MASVIGVESLGTGLMDAQKGKQINMVDYKDDKEEEVEIEKLNDSDFVEEQENSVACAVKSLLMQSEGFYAVTSKFLLKMLNQEQGM